MQSDNSHSSKPMWFELFWLSALALFLELLIIRWLASEIRAFTIFKNFPLIACYVGLGMGFMQANNNTQLVKFFPSLLLMLVILILSADRTGITRMLTPGLAWGGLENAWIDAAHPAPAAISSPTYYICFSIIAFFGLLVLVAIIMASLGQRLGQLFNQGTPLQSYLINLLGSVFGIAGFSLLSLLCTPPLIWVAVCCSAAALLFRHNKLNIAILLTVIVSIAALPSKNIFSSEQNPRSHIVWSPYHRIDIAPYDIDTAKGEKKEIGYQFSANKGYLQQALNLSDNFVSTLIEPARKRVESFRLDQYELPYLFCHPPYCSHHG